VRTSDMIKSKFWRAADVQGVAPMVFTISSVTEELLGRGAHQDVKCFLWFVEHLKGLQLNKSRVRVLEAAYGPDSDLWVGKRVRLSFDPTVEFGGRAVGGVKLQTPPGVVYAAVPAQSWGGAVAAPPGGTTVVPPPPGSAPPPTVWDGTKWVLEQTQAVPAQVAAPPAAAAGTWGGAPTLSQRMEPPPSEFPGEDPNFGHPDIPF
jgi:hypothetical protein